MLGVLGFFGIKLYKRLRESQKGSLDINVCLWYQEPIMHSALMVHSALCIECTDIGVLLAQHDCVVSSMEGIIK